MALNKNSISQIIKTDIFFNSCANENKEIIELIDHLGINNNYEYPKNIVIHNIISKVFITRNEKYLIIIGNIIDKLMENKDQIIDVKDSLMFIIKKISLYKKTNITDKNQYKELEDKINKFFNFKNVKLDEGKNNKKSNLTSSEDEIHRITSNSSKFTMPSISSEKNPLKSTFQVNNSIKYTSSLNYFRNTIKKGENERTKGSNKKSNSPISKGIHYNRNFISQRLNSLVNINDEEDTLQRGINNNEINPVYKPILSKGLDNTGKHYCHMSVCIQLLFSCDDFRNYIIEINLNSFKSNTYNESLIVLDEIQKIFNQILYARNKTNSINYSKSYNILYDIIFPKQKITNQQDSTDILVKILNYNYTEIFNFNFINKQSPKNSAINNILLLSEFNDNGVKITPNTLQNIINIHTKIKNNYSVNTNINKYIIITLNRRSHNNTSYSSDSNGNIIINNKIMIANNKYFLVGSIIKIGTSNSGHYIYVTYDSNGNIYKVYNDSTVKDGNINNIYAGYKLSKLLLTSQYILLFKKF